MSQRLGVWCSGEWGHGRVIVPYTGPAPPTGTHRYVFLLYRNPKDMPLGAIGPQVSSSPSCWEALIQTAHSTCNLGMLNGAAGTQTTNLTCNMNSIARSNLKRFM